MFGRSFTGFSKLKLLSCRIFVIDLFVFTGGASSPDGYNPPLREEEFFCVMCVVSFCVFLLAWFLRFDMSVMICCACPAILAE
jgi:hypothetical protein